MPGNPKPRKKPTPRGPRLPDLLRQTHVLCAAVMLDGGHFVAFCSCGEVFVSQTATVIRDQFRAHRDDA